MHLKRQKDQIHIDLENMLDTEDRPTARMLRLHRYASWYDEDEFRISNKIVSRYETDVERIVFSHALTQRERLIAAEAMNAR